MRFTYSSLLSIIFASSLVAAHPHSLHPSRRSHDSSLERRTNGLLYGSGFGGLSFGDLLGGSGRGGLGQGSGRGQYRNNQNQNNGNQNQNGNGNNNNNQNQGDAVGAAYFITNQPEGNFIVASSIGADGKLSNPRAISAGGAGLHGITDPNGPDPLFSQGAIKVSQAANALVTLNPGSNTLSMYSINSEDPTELEMVGFPVSSGGEFPVAVAFNADATMLCAVNGGAENGVACFKPDSELGLVGIPNTKRSLNLNQTTPASGPAGSVSHVIFSEDGQQLIASVKGVPPDNVGFLAVWDVAEDGSLSEEFQSVAPADGGLLPFSMSVIPGKNAILNTDAGVGFSIFDLSNNNTVVGTSVVPIDGQKATCWSTFSKKTGNFYLTDIGTSTVTEVNVNDNLQGQLVQQYPQQPNSATIDNDIASIGDNDFLYVLSANATTINVLSLDAPGEARSIQNFNFGDAMNQANITIDANNLQGMTVFIRN